MGCKEWYFRSLWWVYRDGETEDEKLRKRLLVLALVSVCLAALVNGVLYHDNIWAVTHYCFLAVQVSGLLFWMWHTKRCSLRFTEYSVMALSVTVIFWHDIRSYGTLDLWSLCVVVMDLLLLLNARDNVVKFVMIFSMFYITFQSLESAFHFGIYDNAPDWSTFSKPKEECRGPIGNIQVRLIAVCLDFIMTRYFASTMHAEQESIRRSVALAQRVAEALVRFDLERAEAELKGGGIEEELREAMHQLLGNLRTYRPYLPESLFEATRTSDDDTSVTAPQGTVAMVFTDIQSSTSLWESCPGGMRKAMQTHNRVMREELQSHRGYEVKTIGDAFMVAFEDVNDAVGFCLSAQEALYRSEEWAEELLEHPLCEPVEGLWNGLRVRMGVHVGEMDMQVNPVTGRADYFGPNVNIAARVEGKAWGGTVAVTDDAYQQLDMESIGDPAVHHIGKQVLKGVGEDMVLHLLAPDCLTARVQGNGSPPNSAVLRMKESTTMSVLSIVSCSARRNHNVSLHEVQGTVGHVRIDYSFLGGAREVPGQVGHVVTAVADAVERTQGVLLTVGSSSMVAGWNLGKRSVHNHATQAAVAVGLMHRSVGEALPGIPAEYVTVGVATGRLIHGSVGTDQQRFMVGIGQTLELAGELSAAASTLQAFALVGAEPGSNCIADDPTAATVSRVVDQWELQNGRCKVYQLRIEVVVDWARGRLEEGTSWGWSPQYAEAFYAQNTAVMREAGALDAAVVRLASVMESRSTGAPFLQRPGAVRSCPVYPSKADKPEEDTSLTHSPASVYPDRLVSCLSSPFMRLPV